MPMNFQPNDLFFTMATLFKARYSPDSKLIIGNEGSSRSSKTWDTFHFIVAFCDNNRNNPQEIFVIRDTLVDCKDFTLEEWKKCLKVIGIYQDNNLSGQKPVYNLWGHKIKFRGLDEDDSTEGYPSDLIFFNEILSCNKSSVMGLIMRCRKLVVMDWNPKYTDHWVFDMEKRADTAFTRTTYKNNRHLQKSVIAEIESFCPYMLEDEHLPEKDRRPNEENAAAGTADPFKWKVYGKGERANKEGLVFGVVKYVDAFPKDIEQIGYGMDFGKSAQTAIVKAGVRWSKPKPDLYLQKLFYSPTESSAIISDVLKILYADGSIKEDQHIWSDNNLPGWISDLRLDGYLIMPTTKFPGSRAYWISSLKKFNIHLVRDPDFQKEQENFSYRVVDGKQLSETIKKFDHLWSASGYCVVGDFRIEDDVTEKKKGNKHED